MRQYHKPIHRPSSVIEQWGGGDDPVAAQALAHDTAAALLHRVRAANDPELVDRLIAYANDNGVDDVAELWATAESDTLPGALWRIYLLRHVVLQDPEQIGYEFRAGTELAGVDQAIAGSPHSPTPEEVVQLATSILRGAFTGDFAVAMERAAAFSRVMAAGVNATSHDAQRVRNYLAVATELTEDAHLWRSGQLL